MKPKSNTFLLLSGVFGSIVSVLVLLGHLASIHNGDRYHRARRHGTAHCWHDPDIRCLEDEQPQAGHCRLCADDHIHGAQLQFARAGCGHLCLDWDGQGTEGRGAR